MEGVWTPPPPNLPLWLRHWRSSLQAQLNQRLDYCRWRRPSDSETNRHSSNRYDIASRSPCHVSTEVALRSCSYHARTLRHIRPLLTLDVAKSVGHSIVSSRLDYTNFNALLQCTSTSNLHRLQVAQNSLARAVCQAPRSVSATDLRRQLHWLPVRQRISYKLAVITYKTWPT